MQRTTDTPEDKAAKLLAEAIATLSRRPEPADRWLDPRSDDCPVSHRQIMEAHRRGELALKRVGRRLLVRASALDAWIETQDAPREALPAKVPEQPSALAETLKRNGFGRRSA